MTQTELAKHKLENWSDKTPPDCGGVCFDWWLVSAAGAGFKLLRETHHTDEDIEKAQSYLRRERDVVGRIKVENVEP